MSNVDQLILKSQNAPEMREMVNHALLQAEIYCLGELEALADSDESDVFITELEDPDGNVFVPCFTQMEHMQDWASDDEPYLIMSGADLFALVTDGTLIFNPESEHEYVLTPDELNALMKR